MKKYFRRTCPNVFIWEELQEEKNKKHKPFKSYVGYKENGSVYYQNNQNLLFEVWKELKPKMNYKQWCKENGLSITPQTQIHNVEHTYWAYEEVRSLTEKLIDLLADKYFEAMATDKQVNLLYNYLNAMCEKFNEIILSNEFGAYEVSVLWNYVIELQNKPFVEKMDNTNISNECWKYINEVRWTLNKLNNFNNYALIPLTQINFLNLCEKNKKGYIITNSNEKVTQIKQGENLNNMKSVNGKNKMERMINKPFKYMGLVVTDDSSNKHLYAEVQQGDFNKYAYFVVYENPIRFNQTLANGRTISKYCFHIDNFDDGKGHDAIFVPSWMALELVNGDVSEKVGYLVAFEKNQWNNPIIAKLDKLDAGCDSIKVLTADNIQGLKYHY